nr:helix-turn-helix domain-containing protein [uncultured Acetobacterium sp.]
MKLSVAVIQEKLGTAVKDANTVISSSLLHLERPVFYAGETELGSDILYITLAEKLNPNANYQAGSALICIGDPPDIYINDELELLIIDDSADIFELSNTIHQIFTNYECWDLNLQQGIRDQRSLQYLLELSDPIFENGLSIMNADYYMIAHTGLDALMDQQQLQLGEAGRISVEQVNLFKNDPKYNEIKNERDVFLYPAQLLPFQTLCKNIFLNHEFVFRLIISETNHPFAASDAALLEHLSQHLLRDSSYLANFHHDKNSQLAALLQSIILGNNYSQTNLTAELKNLDWHPDQVYCAAYIKPSSQDIYNATTTYFCNVIMQDFKESFAFSNNQSIFVLFNVSHIQESRDSYFKRINRLIKDGNFRIGYSHYADGLSHLKICFREAEIALEMGSRHQPQKWTHKFCDAVIPYIFNQMTEELPAQSLYSPIILRLQRYDLKNQTDYVKTLQAYFRNNMNAVQTAKDLFIHRATIVYRLERIKEIGETDLKNDDDLFHVSLTFKLIGLGLN